MHGQFNDDFAANRRREFGTISIRFGLLGANASIATAATKEYNKPIPNSYDFVCQKVMGTFWNETADTSVIGTPLHRDSSPTKASNTWAALDWVILGIFSGSDYWFDEDVPASCIFARSDRPDFLLVDRKVMAGQQLRVRIANRTDQQGFNWALGGHMVFHGYYVFKSN